MSIHSTDEDWERHDAWRIEAVASRERYLIRIGLLWGVGLGAPLGASVAVIARALFGGPA